MCTAVNRLWVIQIRVENLTFVNVFALAAMHQGQQPFLSVNQTFPCRVALHLQVHEVPNIMIMNSVSKTSFVYQLLWISGQHICQFIYFQPLTGDLTHRGGPCLVS